MKELTWFIIGIAFFILEWTLPSFILLFFGFGAWVTAAFCWAFVPSLGLQIGTFLFSSLGFIFLLRKSLKARYIDVVQESYIDELKDRFIGKKAKVIESIKADQIGSVEFNGTLWKAYSQETIEKDQIVEIISKDNITLFVKSSYY